MANLKILSGQEPKLTGGHRMCAGCVAPPTVRQVLMASDKPTVCVTATGCLEVATAIYPYTAWNCSWMHNAFPNAAATGSGIEAAWRSLRRQGKLDDDFNVIVFGGDGGTYDIGLQSLSGAMERGHKLLYVCYDNGAYMNTGAQRSSATPRGTDTTTTPAGTKIPGKKQNRKDLTSIMVAHNIPYVAQASPAYFNDLISKVQRALAIDGPSFINVLAPCPRGWRYDTQNGIDMTRLGVETGFWPLYEVVNGEWRMTYTPKELKPFSEWLKQQGRYKHLFKSENAELLREIEVEVIRNYNKVLIRCGAEPVSSDVMELG
jgi:pyruvate ferredoxin oxidoreductase beta subunit